MFDAVNQINIALWCGAFIDLFLKVHGQLLVYLRKSSFFLH